MISSDAILQCYRALLEQLWQQGVLILGRAAVSALFESALFNARSDHSLLERVQVSDAGLDLSGLMRGDEEAGALQGALEGWVEEFFTALRLLTGDLLVRQFRPLWEAARRELEGVMSHE